MTATTKTQAPFYTFCEEVWNAITHGLGAAASIVGAVFLIAKAGTDVGRLVPVTIYAASMIVLFSMSSIYHSISHVGAKRILRICDHSSVFFLIAGSYSPYTLIAIRGVTGFLLFSVVWITAVIGTSLNIRSLERYKKAAMLCYIVSGWAIVFAVSPLINAMSAAGAMLVMIGGVFYTGGLVFYRLKNIRYMHTVWHFFVLAGAICHYFSILSYVL